MCKALSYEQSESYCRELPSFAVFADGGPTYGQAQYNSWSKWIKGVLPAGLKNDQMLIRRLMLGVSQFGRLLDYPLLMSMKWWDEHLRVYKREQVHADQGFLVHPVNVVDEARLQVLRRPRLKAKPDLLQRGTCPLSPISPTLLLVEKEAKAKKFQKLAHGPPVAQPTFVG